ncbi:MAG: cysteine synthase A [bacterium]|nr:cysteine synthase A [bacterium]
MAKIANKLTELIGNTPLLQLNNYMEANGLHANIIAKLEYFNPLGSAKDRVAFKMIEDGIASGRINKDTTLIEPTSGNTGIGLAFVAATKGMKLILTMPETMSMERKKIVAALGAEIVLTEGALGMKGAIDKANELEKELGNAVVLQQFENESNPEAHRQTTAREIIRDTDGRVDFFVAGVGTGGTITGTGEVLKQEIKDVKIVGVEPANSAVLSGKKPGSHNLQGIGAGFIPKVMNVSILDEIIPVTNEEAYAASRMVAKTEGVLVGITSGAALHAATLLAKREENAGKNIIVLLPDTGERYITTELFDE